MKNEIFQNGRIVVQREVAVSLLNTYIQGGFSVLIMGERGTGKTRLLAQSTEYKMVSVNCASFADDTMAESELFGYVKGAFTGANDDKIGLIKEAEGGVLFMDEVHSLSKRVQSKLMTAFQTNKHNEMEVRRLGATKSEKVKDVHLVFASNRGVDELKECLLPDFYDRIVQHVIGVSPIRESLEYLEDDWKIVWKELGFSEEAPASKQFLNWLRSLRFEGNYRDLQRIAMNYHAYMFFEKDVKSYLKSKGIASPLDFARTQYDTMCSNPRDDDNLFTKGRTAAELEREYHYRLQEWAISAYKTRANAAHQLEVSEKTMNNWKNKK